MSSSIRQHLQAAAGDYRAQHYPGDLAADVLSRRTPTGRTGWWLAAIGSLAAAIALAVVLVRVHSPDTRLVTGITSEVNPDDDRVIFQFAALTVPEVPEDMEMSAPSQDFSLSMPSFATMLDEDDTSAQQDSPPNSKEAA